MTSQTPESPLDELKRRAKDLLKKDGVWLDTHQKELIVTGWSPWPIIIVGMNTELKKADVSAETYLSIYYDLPGPVELVLEDPMDQALDLSANAVYIPVVLAAFRRLMILDDLADV